MEERRGGERVQVVRRGRRSSPGVALSRIAYAIVSIIIVILVFRFMLLLLGANPEAGFVEFVYAISAPLIAPFEAVFPSTQMDRAYFEWNSLLAIAVYAVIAWGVSSLLIWALRSSSTEVVETVSENGSTTDRQTGQQ